MIKAYYLCVMILKLINIRSLLGRSSKRRLVNTVLGEAMKPTHVLGLLLHLNAIFETLRAKDTCTPAWDTRGRSFLRGSKSYIDSVLYR